jgi:hypothetical protein
MADHEDQAAYSNQRKDQPIRQFERSSAVAGKHHSGQGVFVKQNLVGRVEPVKNWKQCDKVEQPAIRTSHSGVPSQQEQTGPDCKPGKPRADLERENPKDEQDYSDCEVFGRKAPNDMLQA